jgi:hypothetical protein
MISLQLRRTVSVVLLRLYVRSVEVLVSVVPQAVFYICYRVNPLAQFVSAVLSWHGAMLLGNFTDVSYEFAAIIFRVFEKKVR